MIINECHSFLQELIRHLFGSLTVLVILLLCKVMFDFGFPAGFAITETHFENNFEF